MNYRLFFLLFALILSAITVGVVAAWRRPARLLILLTAFSLTASAQNWSSFLDSSRAIDWKGAGFTIPNYTANCATQPSLTANSSSAASANASAIQNALNSCDATHNVVNIPAGTYYVNGFNFGSQGKQVLRGAGPNSTTFIFGNGVGCAGGLAAGICTVDANPRYDGSGEVLPGGSQQCSWTGGLSKDSTTLTLSNCGGAPPVNHTIILDQANDTSDTNGIYICDTNIANCGYEGSSGGNNNGRVINGVSHSEQQVAYVTGVSSLGGGSYTVTISPGVYFSNIRSSQNPGAWWPGFVQNDGIENITLDGSSVNSNVGIYDCYQCWVKNVRSEHGGRNHVDVYQSAQDVIRDSYFYAAQGSASESYAIEFEESSGALVENNIFQQVTTPIMFGQGSGHVISFNFNIDVNYSCGGGCPTYGNGAYSSHNAGSEMNLFEGNDFFGIWGDDAWGASDQNTYFRNMLTGWQSGKTASTFPILLRAYVRGLNIVGNVLGQPGYSTQYQAIATSTSGGTGGAAENTSIYSIGWAGTGAACSSGSVTQCDPLGGTTLMRWGNYDTVTAGVKWDSTEASPGAVPYVKANPVPATHTLPASLYYGSTPSWWPSGKPWPPIGPDVTSGNLGTCSGSYSGAQATSSSQCAGGTLTSAWANHATSIPAEDCYLGVMHGVPDGSGSVLSFDANQCYSASSSAGNSPPSAPAGLTATVL
ncbi:MAG: hypothetical protein WCA10_11955 [Terracidiphilus sp.]